MKRTEIKRTPMKRAGRIRRLGVPAEVRDRVLRRDRYVCQYGGIDCGRATTVDHVIPRSIWNRGVRVYEALGFWPDAVKNLVAACWQHNVIKGARLLVPESWAERIDELNGLGLGVFRVWRGDAASLRKTVK